MNKNIIRKRPLSIIFIAIYGAAFAITIVINSFATIDFADFLYNALLIILFFCIPLVIVFLILLFFNLKRSKRRSIWFAIGSGICFILVPATFFLGGLFKDHATIAQEYFSEKNYELAIKYYDDIIESQDDPDLVELANSQKDRSMGYIEQAKKRDKNGDIYFENQLYKKAAEEYAKAFDIFPYLEGIENKTKNTGSLIDETSTAKGSGSSFVLLNENLKFKYISGIPLSWGRVKICQPALGEFQNIKIEEGRFFETDNEIRVSGKLCGSNTIDKYVESSEGLFVFISTAITDKSGNIKWSRDGYLKGDTPYLKSGQIKEFSLTGPVDIPVENGDTLFIAAYLKREVLLVINTDDPEAPDADKNAFALYFVTSPF